MNDTVIKPLRHGMVSQFMEIFDMEYPFLLGLSRFQNLMFKRVHRICTSPNGPTRTLAKTSLHFKTHYTTIESDNQKTKLACHLVQLADLNNLEDLRQELFS